MESLIFSHNHQSTKKGYVSIDAMFQDQLPVFLHGDADPYYLAHFSISLQIATSSLFKIHYPLRGLIYTNFHHAIAHLTIDRCLVTDCNLSSLIHHPSFHPLPSLTPPPNAKQSHNSESPPNNIATHLPTPLSSHPSTLPYQPNLPSTMPPTPLPAHFLRIAKAGSGASGGVYFCVPVSRVQPLTNISTFTPSSPDFPSLKASLVAVKVSSNHWWIENEYAALQEIRNCTSPNAEALRALFPEAKSMGYFTPPGYVFRHAYLELEAVSPPVTLGDLVSFYGDPKNNKPAIPTPLVYHVFLSLGAAVLFLRDEVGWAQDDIKPDNVLVRMYHGAPFALPQFVLIDFGNAKRVVGKPKEVSNDCVDVMGLVRMMVRMAEWDTGVHWAAFRDMVFAERARIRECGEDRKLADERFRGLWERWEGVAKEGRKGVTVGEVEGIKEVFEKVAKRKGRVSDEDLIRAARWYGKTGGGI